MTQIRPARLRPALALVLVSLVAAPATMQELEIATSVSMLEGPAVDRDGNVYFTDILMQRILRFSKDGKFSVFREKSNVANGLVFDLQGRLIAAEGAASPTAERSGMATGGIPRVTRTDLKTGKIEILADKYGGKPLSGPNDVTIDGKGRLYFTDSTAAAVYRIDAPGQIVRILAAPDVQRPNGIQRRRDVTVRRAEMLEGAVVVVRLGGFGRPDLHPVRVGPDLLGRHDLPRPRTCMALGALAVEYGLTLGGEGAVDGEACGKLGRRQRRQPSLQPRCTAGALIPHEDLHRRIYR